MAKKPRAHRRKVYPLWKKLLAAVLAPVLVLGLLEVSLAVVAPQRALTLGPDGEETSERVHRDGEATMRPNYTWGLFHPEFGRIIYQTNGDGIVDHDEHALVKDPSVKRVLLLGDSFTQGFGVRYEESYGYQLEQEFGRDNVEVIKAGVPGNDTYDELSALRVKWRQYRPDVVVVGLLPNDVMTNPSLPVEDRAASGHGGGVVSGLRAFHLFGATKRLLLANDGLYVGIYRNRPIARFLKPPPTEPVLKQLSNTVELLTAIRDECEQVGAELHVLFIPQRVQVMLSRQPMDGLDPAWLGSWLREQLKALDVSFADSLPALARHPATETYYTTDGHLNAFGHEVLAGVLVDHLRGALAR